ncbi:MAG TPA: prepilin-type N-terminal cleavage/methylation domain-containing protein [Verrucomicrobiae bacterium]
MHPRTTHPAGSRANPSRSVSGFTLLELCVALAALAILLVLVMPALAKAQSKMRSNRCLSNLQDVGTAVSLYIQDSNDKLPYAALRYSDGQEEHHLAWDDLMGPYLGVEMTPLQRDQDGASGAGSFKMLSCPQDAIPVLMEKGVDRKESRRSYAMPEHNLGLNMIAGRMATAADWPPSPVNQTGIGIRLDGRPGQVSPRWNQDDEPGTKAAPKWQTSFYVPMITTPSSTLFLTELFDGANKVGSWNGATISDASSHLPKGAAAPSQINYLMVDGHVESRLPAASVTASSVPAGAWTVWQDD